MTDEEEDRIYDFVANQDNHVTLKDLRAFMQCRYDEMSAFVARYVKSGSFRYVYRGKRAIGITSTMNLEVASERTLGPDRREKLRQQQNDQCPACLGALGKRPTVHEPTQKMLCYGCTRVLSYTSSSVKRLESMIRFVQNAVREPVVPAAVLDPAVAPPLQPRTPEPEPTLDPEIVRLREIRARFAKDSPENIGKPDIVPVSSPGPRLAFETKPAPKKYPEHWLETLETDFPE